MNDWITLAEFEIANCKALSIFDKFCKDKQGCESDWFEIEIDGKFFDIGCHDVTGADEGNYREGIMYCALHPTHIVNGDRQTDGTKSTPLFIDMYGEKFIRLFTNGVIKNEK